MSRLFDSLQSEIVSIEEGKDVIDKGLYLKPTNVSNVSEYIIAGDNSEGKFYWKSPYVYNHTSVTSSEYSALITDEIIGVSVESTITLPLISEIGKKKYTITDEGGSASTKNITISV